jgi:predicted AlkP superfamily pyrophosphatase or phosphodiesterase
MLVTAAASLVGTPLSAAAAALGLAEHGARQLVLISIDGFRHDYFDRRRRPGGEYAAPTLRRLAGAGVHATMQPVFPSKTFPNHASLATGLLPESSGIVGNTMYNTESGRWFHTSENDPGWWRGEPIWTTLARTAGRTTATVFWPGSAVAGRRAAAYWVYNASVPYGARVTRCLSLLSGSAPDLPAGRPADFVTLYFEGVDHAGHRHGPEAPEVADAIADVDASIAALLAAAPKLNFVIVSDHGMAAVTDDRLVDLDAAVAPHEAVSIVTSPVLMMLNASTTVQRLYEGLRGAAEAAGHATVYLKEDLPERWHLRGSPLVSPIVGVADIGYAIKLDNAPRGGLAAAARQGDAAPKPANHPVHGDHGFDNVEPDMQALFIASGPAFHARSKVEGMTAVDVYPMLCELFRATQAPNNGSLQRSSHVIRHLL